jgi:nocturnin
MLGCCTRNGAADVYSPGDEKGDIHIKAAARPSQQAALNTIRRETAELGWEPLYERSFQQCTHAALPSDIEVSVMQFNLLADGLSGLHPEKGGFVGTPPDSLDWEKRRWKLLEEVARYDADVICLEECDHFDDWFMPQLALLEYDGVFQKKCHSKCLDFSSLEDGCAIFWRKDKFNCVSQKMVSYADLDASPNDHNQVAVFLTLQPIDGPTSSTFMVCCTHLKAKKTHEGEVTRELQVGLLLDAMQEEQEKSPGKMPWVLCADMNATPHAGKYDALAYPAVMRHQLRVKSAYGPEGADSEPAFTSYKKRADKASCHTIDYIFHNSQAVPTSLLSLPPLEDLSTLPNYRYPSDHFSLVCKFHLRQSSSAHSSAHRTSSSTSTSENNTTASAYGSGGRKLSTVSSNTLQTLQVLREAVDAYEERLLEAENVISANDNDSVEVSALIALRGELAQLNGSIEKLQCTRIDAVVTAELTSGKTDAKERRKELTRRTEKLHARTTELNEQLAKAITRCGGEAGEGEGASARASAL